MKQGQPLTRGQIAAWASARPLLLALDFDGTLAAIAPTPAQARLKPGMRAAVKNLCREPGVVVAMVSGRSLPDLKAKVRIPGLVYVANHGMVSEPESYLGPPYPRWKTSTDKVISRLTPILRNIPGSRLETKGWDVSLHYRQVAAAAVPGLITACREAVAGLPLRLGEGKKVLEFRPRTIRDKGWALKRLARRLARGWRRHGACLYVGDDRTDEDAFCAVLDLGDRAWGVKVGPGPTKARYRIPTVAGVQKLLEALAGPLPGREREG